MITKEQLIEKFGIKAGLKQVEFDSIMNKLRLYECELKADGNKRLDAVEKERAGVKIEKAKLNLQLQELTDRQHDIIEEKRKIVGAFWNAKHELIALNPTIHE